MRLREFASKFGTADISDEIRARLFEPFTASQLRAGGSGLGLGLYIVSLIAHAHGGSVAVTSSPEDETEVRLELPRGE